MLLEVYALFAVIPAILGDCPAGRETAKTSAEARLISDLTCDYVDDMRPVKDHKTAVNVSVMMSVKYITFDDQEEILTIHSWLGLVWRDEYLTWDPANYAGLQEVQIESHRIWQPQLALYNADANSYPTSSFYSPCVVNATGRVLCVPHVTHAAICSSKLRNWPYDTQNCTLRFGSWMHSGEQVNFNFSSTAGVNIRDFQAGPGWKLLSVTYDRTAGNYACCPNDTYPSLRYHFALQRLAAGPAAIVAIPCIAINKSLLTCWSGLFASYSWTTIRVIVLLTLASLLMDVKDNSRLGLACFSLFGHFVFLTEIGYDLPKHSSDTPIILLFLRDSMVLNLVGIFLTLILSHLRLRVDPPHAWITKTTALLTSGPAKFAIFTEFEPALLGEKSGDDIAGSSAAEGRAAASNEWISFCNVFNSLSFGVLLVVYLVLIIVYIPR